MKTNGGYRQISDELRAEIQSGDWKAGEYLPPERQLCARWHVERTTLRRALALLAEEGLIEKRSGVGSRVCGDAGPLVAFVTVGSGAEASVLELSHHFMTPVSEAFTALCARHGCREISVTLNGQEAALRQSFQSILETSSALILADDVPQSFLQAVRAANKPCVLLSQRGRGFRSVLCDNDSGLTQAVEHLAALGHRHIAFLGGEERFYNSRMRVEAFRRALAEQGLKGRVMQCGWGIEQGEAAMRLLFEQDPSITAVCAVNDYVALGACRAAAQRGKAVPGDFSVVGFGDTLSQAEYRLSSVTVSPERVAQELWQALEYERAHPFKAPASVLVEAELVVRETSGPVRQDAQ